MIAMPRHTPTDPNRHEINRATKPTVAVILLCARAVSLHAAAEADPMAATTHQWTMSADSAAQFEVRGDVKLGVSEAGATTAARFDGGSLVLKEVAPPLRDMSAFTLRARVKPDGDWIAGTLLSQRGPGKQGSGAFDLAAWHMPFLDRRHLAFHGMIRNGLPPAAKTYFSSVNIGQEDFPVDASGWRDILIRRSAKGPLELFLDGRRVASRSQGCILPGGLSWSFTGKPSPLVIGADADGGDPFCGWIDEVAIWDRALGDEELAAVCGTDAIGDGILPQKSLAYDAAKRRIFGPGVLAPDSDPADRYDWVDKKLPSFHAELLRTNPHYPRYHLALPGQQWNPIAFFHKGRYHVFFGWTPGGCFRYFDDANENIVWQHISSEDLIRWTIHPMPIRHPHYPNENGFFFDNGKGEMVVLYYGDRGYEPRMAVSRDPDLARWEAFPDLVKFRGVPEEYQCRHDPSGVFKIGDTWHLIATTVRPQAGAAGVPLYKSKDLLSWEFSGEFHSDATGRPVNECGQLLRIDGWDVFTAIHDLAKGQQYLAGRIRPNGTFDKKSGGSPDLASDSYNCVTTAVNDRGEAIQWRYLNQVRPYRFSSADGWWNAYGGPRRVRIDGSGRMLVRPDPSLEKLRGAPTVLDKLKAASSEIKLTFAAGETGQTGIRLGDGRNHIDAFYDHAEREIAFDFSGLDERITKNKGKPRGPVTVKLGGTVTLRLFSDRSVVELFANDEVALSSQAFFHDPENLRAEIVPTGGAEAKPAVEAWEINPLQWPTE